MKIRINYPTRVDNPVTYNHFVTTTNNRCDVKQIVNPDSLTIAYNQAIREAIKDGYDILVLAHDDIRLEKDWDIKLNKHFEDDVYDILGFAGSAKINQNLIWWQEKQYLAGIVEHQQEINGKLKKYKTKFSEKHEDIMDVVVIDGLFMAIKLKTLKFHFDELIKGFHFYDVIFCIDNFVMDCKIGVITNINVLHKSIGKLSPEWENNRLKLVESYKELLPLQYNNKIVAKHCYIKGNNKSKVAIIIPTKNKTDLLFQTIDSIIETTYNTDYKIYIADTGSDIEEKQKIKDYIQNHKNNITLIEYDYYNFAKINNDVILNHVDKEYNLVLLCNNDIKLMNNCIDQAVEFYNKNKKTVGTIGIRMYYENNTIQHSGIIVIKQPNGNFAVTHKGLKTYYGYHDDTTEVFGNTGAFLMINKELFFNLKGLNEEYTECFEDVELNLECLICNKKNYIMGSAVAYHYESQTRKEDENMLKRTNHDFQILSKKLNKYEKKFSNFINKF